jgi:tetratricopeptide (TPR) repeat protein/transcriptional regulator with XRE-family HTH domain
LSPVDDHRNIDISDLEFPARLKRFRHAVGFTKQQMSIESGVSERTIIKFESGRGKKAKDSTLLALCKTLNITLDQLIPPPLKPAPPQEPPPAAEGGLYSKVKSWLTWRRLVIDASILLLLIAAWSVIAGPFSPYKIDVGNHTITIRNRLLDTFNFHRSDDPAKIHASRLYAEGCENLKRLYRDEARACFKAATERDSTFAKAYVMQLHPNIRPSRKESLELIAKARALESYLTPAEKLFLSSMEAIVYGDNSSAIDSLERLTGEFPYMTEAYRILAQLYLFDRNYPKAIGCLKAAVTADSLDGMSFNRLAYVYLELGQYDYALAAAAAYLKLAPAEPNPYDTQGDILCRMGRCDEAIASYHLALERKPDFFPSLQSLGRMYLFKGDYDQAEKYYRELGRVDDPGARYRSKLYVSCVRLYQGRFDEALDMLNHCIEEERHDPCALGYLPDVSLRSLLLLEKGETGRALDDFRRALDESGQDSDPDSYDRPITTIQLLSAVDMDQARQALDRILIKSKTCSKVHQYKYWFCKGWLEMVEEHPEAAVASFSRAEELVDRVCIHYQLALACLQANHLKRAIEEFEKVLGNYTDDRVQYALWSVKAHYYLSQAYLQAGRAGDADRQLRIFLEHWRQADWDCRELAEARRQAAKIASNRCAP